MTAAAEFTDRFDSDGYTAAKWFAGDGTPFTLDNGQLNITATADYPGLVSEGYYDLRSSSFHVEIVQIPNIGLGSTSAIFGVRCAAGSLTNREEFQIEGGVMYMQEVVGGTPSQVSLAFDAVAHRWLRLRESAGTLYWETSPNGLNWTVRRSKTPNVANTLDQAQAVLAAGFYDAETDAGTAIFDNFNTYKVPANQRGWSVGAIGMGAKDGGTLLFKNFFPQADWLWTPIPDNPVLDPNSAAIIADLCFAGVWNGETFSGNGGVSVYDVSAALISAPMIRPDTPRYRIELYHANPDLDNAENDFGYWGPSPFGDDLIPIPDGTVIPTGTDGHLAIADPVNRKVYSLWQAVHHPDGSYTAAWAGVTDIDGDGLELHGSSTAANISRYAAVIRLSEIAAREIPHALFFAAGNTETNTYQYPALKSDGFNYRGTPHPIREGQRIQLDPDLDLDSLPGITPAELAVGRAMQKYGAYCGDKSHQGAGWGFICQLDPTATSIEHPGQTYVDAGIQFDYWRFNNIPWSTHLRVLDSWDGS